MTKKNMIDRVNEMTTENMEEVKMELLEYLGRENKQAKKHAENENILKAVFEVLEDVSEFMTIKQIQEVREELSGYSNQKISPQIQKLIKDGKVQRHKEGKYTYYGIVGIEFPTKEELALETEETKQA